MVHIVDGYESFSYSYSNCALCTNLFDGRIRRKIENTKIVTWLLLYSPTNQQQLKRKGVIRLKGVRMKLEHSWSKAGKFSRKSALSISCQDSM